MLSPKLNSSNITLVRDLIQDDGTEWNSEVISANFIPYEQDIIKQIPIIHPRYDDELMWMLDADGIYTVKSGYQALQRWKNTDIDKGSTSYTSTAV